MISVDDAVSLTNAKKSGNGYIGTCPCSVHKHGDRKPSLGIMENPKNSEQAVLKCFAGGDFYDVLNRLKEMKGELPITDNGTRPEVEAYSGGLDYEKPDEFEDEPEERGVTAKTYYEVAGPKGKGWRTRTDYSDGSKDIRWAEKLPDGHSSADYLYAPKCGHIPVFTEGEKAADAVNAIGSGMGYMGVGTVTGANGTPNKETVDWVMARAEQESDSPIHLVILWPDNDQPGFDHMARLREQLPSEVSIHVADVSALPTKADAADVTEEMFTKIIEQLPSADHILQKKGVRPQGNKPRRIPDSELAFGPPLSGTMDKPWPPPHNFQQLYEMLQHYGVEVRGNVLANRNEIRLQGSDRFVDLEDSAETAIRKAFERYYTGEFIDRRTKKMTVRPYKLPKEDWIDEFNVLCYELRYDPFIDMIESGPEWDGTHRLETLLGQLFNAQQDEFTKWAMKAILLTPLERAFWPDGHVPSIHQTVVFLGEQGIGKSQFLEMLIPPEHRGDWFRNNAKLSSDPKQLSETIKGSILVEFSEMSGMRKSDIDDLKGFLTLTNDGQIREPYARRPVTSWRRCVFVGTTNNKDCLPNDPTGLRRWVVIELPNRCDYFKMKRYMEDNRAQLWAEAYYRMQQGERASLPVELVGKQSERNEQHRQSDPLFENLVASDEFYERATANREPDKKGRLFIPYKHIIEIATDILHERDYNAHEQSALNFDKAEFIKTYYQAGEHRLRKALDHAGWAPIKLKKNGTTVAGRLIPPRTA